MNAEKSWIKKANFERALYIDDRWPGAWKSGVWMQAADVVLNG